MNIEITLKAMRDNGATDEELKQAYSNFKQTNRLFSEDNPGIIDRKTGLPPKVRALMGNMSPPDQLKTLQHFYPDAQPQDDNFVYTNPKTGLKTFANPPGLDVGDVAQNARAISQTVGGGVGAVAATTTGNPLLIPVGMGLGDAIGGQIHDKYMNYLGREDTRGPIEQGNSAAVDVGMGMAIPKIIEKGMDIVKPIFKGLMNPVRRFKENAIKKAVSPESLDQFNTLTKRGYKPEASMLVDTPESKAWAASTRGVPGSGNVVGPVDDFNYQHGIQQMDELAKRYGTPKSKVSIGADIRKGVNKAESDFWKKSKELFDKRDAVIPLDEKLTTNNTLLKIKEISDEIGNSNLAKRERASIIRTIKDLRSDLNADGTMDMRSLKAAKEALGDVYRKAIPDGQDHLKKELYKAINADIDVAAINRGAKNIVDEANDYYKVFKGNKAKGTIGYLDTIHTIQKKTEDGSIYKWVTQNLGEGNKRLTDVFKLLPETMQNDVRASIIQKSAQMPDGSFSFSRFLTNMADKGETRMSKEAKDFLFKGNKQAYKHLQDIEKSHKFFKDLEKYKNFSNTETNRMWHEITQPLFASMVIGAGTGATGGFGHALKNAVIGGAIGTGIATGKVLSRRQTAKIMTDPVFLKWLADGAKMAITKPGKVSTQLIKLPIIAQTNPKIKEELQVYMNAMSLPFKVIHNKKGSVIKGVN